MSKSKDANKDTSEEATQPKAVSLEKLIATSLLVPMGDPNGKTCPMGLNLMLWGEPGIGKSDRVEAAAAAVGLPTHTVFAATCQPEDASGVAFPNASKGVAMIEAGLSELHRYLEEPLQLEKDNSGWWSPPKGIREVSAKVLGRMLKASMKYGPHLSSLEPSLPGIRELMTDGQGVLFLDELSCARPAVQAAFLGIVLYRKVGGLKLPPGVRVIAAANPPESAAGGWELELPMANRFCHIDVKVPKLEQWGAWLMNEQGERLEAIEHGEAKVRAGWSEHFSIVKGNIWGYLQAAGQDQLHAIPAAGDKNRGKAWPSPRTWAFASRAIATCRCLGMDAETTMTFVEGCIGEGAATPYAAWLLKADLPHPLDALKKGWTVDTRRLDRCQAVYTSIVSYVTSRPTEKERIELAPLAWNRLNDAIDANLRDLILDKAHMLVKAGLDTKAGSQAITDAAQPVMVHLAKAKMGQYLTP